MRISRSSSLSSPFVVTEDDLTKICNSFAKFANKENVVELEMESTDNLTRKYSRIEELLEFENTPKNMIKSILIKIFVHEVDNYRIAYLTLSDDKLSNVYISLEGPEKDVIKLNESIEDYLQGMKPWYSRVTNVDFFILLMGLLLLFFLFILGASWFGLLSTSGSSSTNEQSDKADVILAIIFISPLLFGFLLNWLRSWIFPLSYFAIGQGKKRYNNSEMVRIIIVIGLVVSILGSLTVKIIWN